MNRSEDLPDFIILGASLDTGNLGVSALLASTVKCIRANYPAASIWLLDGTREAREQVLRLTNGQTVRLPRIGVRCNKLLWRQCHLVRLLLTSLLLRLIPGISWRRRAVLRNPFLAAIDSAECVADITGGDSFSDIYGLRRLLLGTARKLLILASGRDLVLLPQTYGPFRTRLGRMLARYIIQRSSAVYARDRASLEMLSDLVRGRRLRAIPEFCPDLAFVLDAIRPSHILTLPGPLPTKTVLVGFNVSGLLYNGGYTRNNMFGLNVDYRSMVLQLASALLARENAAVLFVPHVFRPPGEVESDPEACRLVYESLQPSFPGRVFLLEGEYDQSEIKYVIGQCGFFLGSRMHACIAAASQGIATVPLAYSRKFRGVFEAIGAGNLVADLQSGDAPDIIDHVLETFRHRGQIESELCRVLPAVQRQVLNLFAGYRTEPVAALVGACP